MISTDIPLLLCSPRMLRLQDFYAEQYAVTEPIRMNTKPYSYRVIQRLSSKGEQINNPIDRSSSRLPNDSTNTLTIGSSVIPIVDRQQSGVFPSDSMNTVSNGSSATVMMNRQRSSVFDSTDTVTIGSSVIPIVERRESEGFSKDSTNRVSIGSSLIPLVNKLQDIFAPFGCLSSKIKLPQVVVIGSQSSGKSSVLEALVGRDFLPRGCDICTRRPLVLQLENRQCESDGDAREWGEFLHLPGKRFYDFSAIRREIQAETEREAGINKDISDKQIRLKILSPNVLNITLVDLPGITKVPVGDQPSDIEKRIRTMIMSYINHQACIILAVTPANSDLATSDALQMARNADPSGSRTIGVITKLDIMDRGTDARNFLLGKVVPLCLGYVGVINRSQEDINRNRCVAEALAYEQNFFRDHPVYQSLHDRCGIPQLAKKLNLVLGQHIRALLPQLKADIKSQMDVVAAELNIYGEVMKSKADQGAVLLNILTKYCDALSSLVDGKSQEMSTLELTGGARIHYLFQSVFVKILEEVDPCDGLTDEDIWTAIQNSVGPKNVLFVPEVPLEVLVRRQIARLLDPSLKCPHLVYDELIKMSNSCEVVEMQRFPFLKKRLDGIMREFLQDGVQTAEKMIEGYFEVEMDYINTSHPNFIDGSEAVEIAIQQLRPSKDAEKLTASGRSIKSLGVLAKSVSNGSLSDQGCQTPSSNEKPQSAGPSSGRSWGISSIFGAGEARRPSEFSERQTNGKPVNVHEHSSRIQLKDLPDSLRPSEVQTEYESVKILVTKLLLRSYYDIVRRHVQDFVPKTIMHFLVNHMKRDLLSTFIQKLYRENLFDEMLQEQEDVITGRKRAREIYEAVQNSLQTLEAVEVDVCSSSTNSSFVHDTYAGLHRLADIHSSRHTDFTG